MTDDFLLVYTLKSDRTDEKAPVVRPHLQHDKETRLIYMFSLFLNTVSPKASNISPYLGKHVLAMRHGTANLFLLRLLILIFLV